MNQCIACCAALAADNASWGRKTCPRCNADMWFVTEPGGALFVLRDARNPATRLLDRPSIDSLEAIELVMEIDENPSIEIPDNEIHAMETVADVARYFVKTYRSDTP